MKQYFAIMDGKMEYIGKLTPPQPQLWSVGELCYLRLSIDKCLDNVTPDVELADIRGHEHIKRGLEVAMVQRSSVCLIPLNEGVDEAIAKFIRLGSIVGNTPVYIGKNCDCNNYKSMTRACSCDKDTVEKCQQYIRQLDADMYLEVPTVRTDVLLSARRCESTETVMIRVGRARELVAEVDELLDETCRRLVKAAVNQMNLTNDQLTAVLKLSKSIAALSGSKTIQPAHIAEALQYRPRN